ncbi:hypothetical protein GCM10010171_02310 [Actinokineospora fastidiosa]|uniref:Uncharacterized protein n=1 Tax=Actinokineospora fastidiosa TaxID=1816 RepID=A0A918G1P0_9PSEU|nr:hypothetical protein GCM10010171_02310 [Actinokineospora fastidiosa]
MLVDTLSLQCADRGLYRSYCEYVHVPPFRFTLARLIPKVTVVVGTLIQLPHRWQRTERNGLREEAALGCSCKLTPVDCSARAIAHEADRNALATTSDDARSWG